MKAEFEYLPVRKFIRVEILSLAVEVPEKEDLVQWDFVVKIFEKKFSMLVYSLSYFIV